MGSIEAEFQRYKAMGEAAMDQLAIEELRQRQSATDNSIATLVWHIAGNLESRFTDFLDSDGEKPWRDRESEFQPREASKQELEAKWQKGWSILLDTLRALSDDDLRRNVTIRGVAMAVHEALHRALAHVSYHVGQIVYLSKMVRGDAWSYLTIPPGQSQAYNRTPAFEKAADHAAGMSRIE